MHGTINALGGNLDAARRDFNEVLSMNPDFGDALVGLANVEALEGNIPAALEGYDSALTAYPDHEPLGGGICVRRRLRIS